MGIERSKNMQIKRILMNKERWVFQLILTIDNRQQLVDFIGKLELASIAYINLRNREGEIKVSIKCLSEEDYKEVFQYLDKLIMEYI